MDGIEKLTFTFESSESPFTWGLPSVDKDKADEFLNTLLDKCKHVDEDSSEFKWRSFSIHLVLAVELWLKLGDIVCAKYHINKCYKELKHLTKQNCEDDLFSNIHAALWKVTLTTRGLLFLKSGDIKHAEKTKKKLELLSELTTEEKAGLNGIKAAVFAMYKPVGLKQALEYAILAQNMDPGQAEWHYLVAYCLGKMRSERYPVTQLELDEIRLACKLRTCATYLITQGQVCADYSKNTSSLDKTPAGLEKSILFAKNAVSYFKKGLQMSPKCPRLRAHVAHGLLNVPHKSANDITVAKLLLDEVEKEMPKNSNVLLDLGVLYDKFEMDSTKAQEYLTKAHLLGNYQAFLYLLPLKWKSNLSSSLTEEIQEALTRYNLDDQVAELMVYLGATYLLLKEDWVKAVDCFLKSLELDPMASHMQNFHGFSQKSKFNILEIVTNELRIKTKENQTNMKSYDMFLGKVISINQKLFKKPTVPLLFTKFKNLQMMNKFTFQLGSFSVK